MITLSGFHCISKFCESNLFKRPPNANIESCELKNKTGKTKKKSFFSELTNHFDVEKNESKALQNSIRFVSGNLKRTAAGLPGP